MTKQTKAPQRPVHRVPALIAFSLAGVFLVLGFLLAPAHFLFAAFSAFCGLIWALGGGGQGAIDTDQLYRTQKQYEFDGPYPGGLDAHSVAIYGHYSDRVRS